MYPSHSVFFSHIVILSHIHRSPYKKSKCLSFANHTSSKAADDNCSKFGRNKLSLMINVYVCAPRNISAVMGQTSHLNCTVRDLGDRTVEFINFTNLPHQPQNLLTYSQIHLLQTLWCGSWYCMFVMVLCVFLFSFFLFYFFSYVHKTYLQTHKLN